MSHSTLPPSSSHIWGAADGCTGWVKMINSVPEEIRNAKSPESIAGDVAHDLSARMISTAARAGIGRPVREELIGSIIDNTVVTEEMYESCELYSEDVQKVMRDTRIMGGAFFGVEEQVSIMKVHKDCWGTTDVFILDHANKTLYVWDFKYGHVFVDAYRNWQVICYAIGLITRLASFDDLKFKIVIRVVQPRAYGHGGPIHEWVLDIVELKNYMYILNENAHTAMGPNACNRTGPHCRYCGARAICPDALKAGLLLYEYSSIPMPQNMPPEAMATQYAILARAKEQIEGMESAFKEQIKYLIKSGKNVTGYMLESAMGRERWTRPEAEIITMGKMMGKDLSNIKALTPNQARKKHIDESLITAFSERPVNGTKLVKSNTQLASKIFNIKE